MRIIRAFFNGQTKLSRGFDSWLPKEYRRVGIHDYADSLVPKYLDLNQTIYDVGGGKHPCLSPAEKLRLNATVIGLDIDRRELDRAPAGAYNETICADLAVYRGTQNADRVVCRALLEHIRDVEGAFTAIASILQPGGIALLFVPSRNAVFARLNLLMPRFLKMRLLRIAYARSDEKQGFTSYYTRCTPSDFRKMAADNDLTVVEARHYFTSGYFLFLFPIHFLWRLWILAFRCVRGDQAAETFAMALRKNDLR